MLILLNPCKYKWKCIFDHEHDSGCPQQEMTLLLEPMSIMFASKGYKVDDVVQEVRRMQTGWQHSDYRAWLKHYTTGKRPRSVLEDSKQLLRRDGGDAGAGPRDMGTGWDLAYPLLSARVVKGIYIG